MKKNTMMRVASVLLVAVLLTTCAISGTYAKYVTSATSSDSARVAYWGFSGTTFSIEDLFSTTYTNVKSNDTDDVIAPGTDGSATFSFQPQNATAPEVAYKITVDVVGTIDADIAANTNIQWKLDTGAWGSFDDMCAAIEGLSTGATPVPAGTFHEKWGATSTHTIYWQWLINDVSDANDPQNIQDTALGNKTTLDEVSITITILAEQVD